MIKYTSINRNAYLKHKMAHMGRDFQLNNLYLLLTVYKGSSISELDTYFNSVSKLITSKRKSISDLLSKLPRVSPNSDNVNNKIGDGHVYLPHINSLYSIESKIDKLVEDSFYVPEINEFLESRKIDKDTAIRYQFISNKGDLNNNELFITGGLKHPDDSYHTEDFRNSISIPIRNWNKNSDSFGKIIGFSARYFDWSTIKFTCTIPDGLMFMPTMNEDHDTLLITEGWMDAISYLTHGNNYFDCHVVSPISGYLSDLQVAQLIDIIELYNIKKLICALDNDGVGIINNYLIYNLLSDFVEIEFLDYDDVKDDYKDLDELTKNGCINKAKLVDVEYYKNNNFGRVKFNNSSPMYKKLTNYEEYLTNRLNYKQIY